MRALIGCALLLGRGRAQQGTGYSQVTPGFLGSPDCPCVNPFSLEMNVSYVAPTQVAGVAADGQPANAACPWQRTDTPASTACYPASYGTPGCGAHDMTHSAECAGCDNITSGRSGTACDWCPASWCWVDPRQCLRPHQSSSFMPTARYGPGPDAPRLSFSYETCDNIDTFKLFARRRDELLRLAPIRVSFPNSDSSGTHIVKVPTAEGKGDSIGGTGHDGSTVQFVLAALNDLGVSYSVVDRSASSLAYGELSGSSFTGCVHEVGLNGTDMCIGNFWVTSERMELASFTVPLFKDIFHVVAFKNAFSPNAIWSFNATNTSAASGFNATGFIQMALVKPFAPFDGTLWGVIFATVVYVGIAMWIIEGATNNGDFPNSRAVASGMVEGVFKTNQAFIGPGDHRFSPSTLGGKVIVTVLSFSFLVLVALYGARITANFVQTDRKSESIASLDEHLERGARCCALEAMEAAIVETYPKLRMQVVRCVNAQAMFTSMDEGLCDLAIITEDMWLRARTGDFSRPDGNATGVAQQIWAGHEPGAARYHCDTKHLLQDASFSVSLDNALPTRRALQTPLSWALTRFEQGNEVQTGRLRSPFLQYRDNARTKFLPPPLCDKAGGSLTQADAPPVDIMSGGGVIFLTLIATTACLLVFCVQDYRRAKRIEKAESAASILLEPPTLASRVFMWGPLTRLLGSRKGGGPKKRHASELENERGSTAFRRDDLKLVEQVLSARQLTNVRCQSVNDPLCISDVPMLLRLMRRAARMGTGEMLAASGLVEGEQLEARKQSMFAPETLPPTAAASAEPAAPGGAESGAPELPEEYLLSSLPESKSAIGEKLLRRHILKASARTRILSTTRKPSSLLGELSCMAGDMAGRLWGGREGSTRSSGAEGKGGDGAGVAPRRV